MKKLSLVLVAALSLSTTAFAEDGVSGSNGQIQFKGTITEKGCTILPGTSTSIDLGSMSEATLTKREFGAWGTGELEFVDCNLDLEEDGTPLEAVVLSITPGSASSPTDTLWSNNGSAKGVGIEVEIAGQLVKPAGVEAEKGIEAKINPTNGTATYKVRGRMAKDGDVKAGSVETTISFVASYK